MISLKPGVHIADIRPEVVLALTIADAVYIKHGAMLVVTSVRDGKHMTGSLHYSGAAADLRTGNLKPVEVAEVATQLRAALGPDFDVVVETDHIHLEFDPKTGGF